ncbi:hypothetical protein BHE74_00042084 [Ensete ventricosum]|uniref:Uncharacterized protein n=1 Tax=Ensete ventricosum TaxID=4639 RepID=A0A444GC62_ENSVE|nr:hypothetical protein B296_00041253 [Ensete ventricosum]RWW32467.1 hypothetical protein GW17_00002859 [Ensete ventricosum]RWW51568.1 hypothetical protein BHE74_00042084 [Ensete ventricosum]RZS17936.1 hypothetical protein BHM03_00050143 [Ensete ventricosum]
MLQRAASNAYSWWWASHVRTKQSKWLDGNLQGRSLILPLPSSLYPVSFCPFATQVLFFYRLNRKGLDLLLI